MPEPRLVQPKKIVQRLKSPHPQFHNAVFIDPYAGCELGCAYCYGVKEEHLPAAKGPSPFRIAVKTNCAFILNQDLPILRALKQNAQLSVGVGFGTEPYQPVEEKLQITRRCLEIFQKNACPVHLLTKSRLVLRDRGILEDLSARGLVTVSVSLCTMNKDLAEMLEPRAPSPAERLDLIAELRGANITCGAMLMPIFPYLTDAEKELSEVYGAIKRHQALYCVPGVLNLSHEHARKRVETLLEKEFPALVESYRHLYDRLGRPALNYLDRMEKLLAGLAERFELPAAIPAADASPASGLVVKDRLDPGSKKAQ